MLLFKSQDIVKEDRALQGAERRITLIVGGEPTDIMSAR